MKNQPPNAKVAPTLLIARPVKGAERAMRGLEVLMRELESAAISAPLGHLEIPPYVEARCGNWRLMAVNAPPFTRAYYSGYTPIPQDKPFFALLEMFEKGKEALDAAEPTGVRAFKRIWMSVAPMETESQVQGVQEARGRVLVGGLGMGLVAYNLLKKKEVDEVIVVERSPEVIKLMLPTLDLWRSLMPTEYKKLRLVQGDFLRPVYPMLGLKAPRDLDHLEIELHTVLADIWPMIGDDALRADMKKIVELYPAERYGAWGMEIDFVDWLATEKKVPVEIARQSPRLYQEYADSVYRARVIGYDEPRMVALSLDAAMQQFLS